MTKANQEVIKNNAGNRDFSITFIQVICAISVVTLHTNDCFWHFSATERYWFTANIIECLCYFGVPLFFMITGITLLDYRERYSTRVYFLKRFEKTVIPYIVWSLVGIIFLLVTKRIMLETLTVKWIINGLLSTSGIINLYWFFQPLFCMYLCVPLFSLIEKKNKEKAAKYIIFISFFVNILPPFLNNVLGLGFQWPYSISVASGYIFWLWSGYYIYHFPPTKGQKKALYLLSFIGLLLHMVGTYILSIDSGEVIGLYKGYNNIPCILYSLGIFQFLRDFSQKLNGKRIIRRIIEVLGKYTFSLYLLHWFVLKVIQDLMDIDWKSILFRLFAPYPILLVVIVITWCLRKIPGIRKIVP